MYRLYDTCGYCFYQFGPFKTWEDADNFRCLMGRPDWKIKDINI